MRSLRLFAFICVAVGLDFPLLALSLWVVLRHNSVSRHVYFLAFLLLTAAFSVDSSIGTFSESIPGKSARFLTLMSADSSLLSDLFVLKPLLVVSFRTIFPFSLRSLVFGFSRRRRLNLASAERKPCSALSSAA